MTQELLGLKMRIFPGIFLYEPEHIAKPSNLHQCKFKV